MTEPGRRLADDHSAIDEVLQELKTALEFSDVETSHAKLDLFWARLAVHIRAEHLHLFPTVITAVREKEATGLALDEAEATVAQLCDDHNFFMHELAEAIQTIRGKLSDKLMDLDGLKKVQSAVLEIERRLVRHNELEENKVYRWAGIVLNEQEQVDLAKNIERELANRPPRFSPEVWQHS
ncbi:MAG TPA: hypothetical protein VLA93_14735 [Pyrinomonadaceae bacterium]|nr:hypothetical protein [Pyrinomonadaceae bacterium]